MAIYQSAPPLATISLPGYAVVYVRASWDDPWELLQYLTPVSATLTASPSVGTAELVYEYGLIKREDTHETAWYQPLNLLGYFVKITHLAPEGIDDLWYGTIQGQQFSLMGSTAEPSGTQTLLAYGLEHLLDRNAIVGARTAADAQPTSYMPPFNFRQSRGPGLIGNRTTDGDENGIYYFGGFALWSALDTLNYLINYHAPNNIPISLGGQFDILDSIHAVWSLEGLTLKQAFDKLIDRRRGLGWTLRTTDDGATIHVFTLFAEPVELPDITIAGNAEIFSIDWSGSHLYADTIIEQSTANRFDTIIVQGARVKTCFSVADELIEGWNNGQETLYNAVTGDDETFADIARGADSLRNVYQHQVLPKDWNWMANDGKPVSIAIDENGDFDYAVSAPALPPTTLLRALPVPDTGPDGEIEYLEPAAWIKCPDLDDAWVRTDLLGDNGQPALSLRMLDHRCGIELKGAVPHLLAKDIFEDELTNYEPAYSYLDVVATVAIETDTRVSVTKRLSDGANTLTIDVPWAELWLVIPGTITNFDADGEPEMSPGEITRDDRPQLRAIAALAAAWYGTPRAVVRWTEKRYSTLIIPGMLCENATSSWQQAAVNTAVTSVQFDFRAISTTIQTNYGELDFAVLLDIPGLSDFRAVGRQFNKLAAKTDAIARSLNNLPTRTQSGGGGGIGEGACVMGRIRSKVDQYEYKVDLYGNGLRDADGTEKSPTKTNQTCIVGDIDAMEQIPPGTCVYVVSNGKKLFIQPPIWLD